MLKERSLASGRTRMSVRIPQSIFVVVLLGILLISSGCRGKSSDKLPKIPALALELTPGTPGNQDVAADAPAVAMHLHLEAVGSEDVSISAITLSASGTGNDLVDISAVEVYLDVDDSDSYDAGTDALIASGVFDSNNGRASITFGSPQIVSTGPGRNWLFLCNLNGNGPDGATYSLGISSASDVSVKYLSGLPTSASGIPITSSVLTITSGGARLNLLAGLNPPASRNVLAGRTDIPMLQFALYNRDSAELVVASIRVTPSGTGNDLSDITQAHIYVDIDADGEHDLTEPLFADFSYAADDTSADVSGNRIISPGEILYFLVVHDFDSDTADGSTFQAKIAAVDHIQAQDAGLNPVTPTGTAPIEGNAITVVDRGELSVQLGPSTPAGASVIAGTTNAAVLQLEFQANEIEDVAIDSLVLQAAGNADDASDFLQISLYEDVNGNGSLDPGDSELASSQYASDNGTATFSGVGAMVAAGSSAYILVAYDVSPGAQAGGTFRSRVTAATDITTAGGDSGLPITPTGTFPITGGTFEIRIPDTFLAASNLNTGRFMHTQTTFTDPNDGKVKVLICGGHDGTSMLDTAEVYDEPLDTWTLLATPMSKPRMLHSATLLSDGEQVLIAGGTDGVILTYQDGEIFDPATYSFIPVNDLMTSRRQMHTATLLDNGDVFFYGGQYILGDLVFVSTTELYNEGINRFDTLGTSIWVRVLHTMNVLSGGTVVVTGGLGYARSGPKQVALLKSVQLWATSPTVYESPSWLTLSGLGRCGHVGVSLPGGRLLITGGYHLNLYLYTVPPFTGPKTAEIIKENTSTIGDETIEAVGGMSSVRFLPVAELLPDGRVLIAGGSDDSLTGLPLNSAELYNPLTATFSDSTGTMNQRRYRATSSMIAGPDNILGTDDDFVLISGGLTVYVSAPGPAQITDSTEIYAP